MRKIIPEERGSRLHRGDNLKSHIFTIYDGRRCSSTPFTPLCNGTYWEWLILTHCGRVTQICVF